MDALTPSLQLSGKGNAAIPLRLLHDIDALSSFLSLYFDRPDVCAPPSWSSGSLVASLSQLLAAQCGRCAALHNAQHAGGAGEASWHRLLATITLLVRAGADPSVCAAREDVCAWQTAGDCAPIIAMLLAAGVDPNRRLAGGATPLINAIAHGHAHAAALLLAAGARVRDTDRAGRRTPLAALCERVVRLGTRPLTEEDTRDTRANARVTAAFATPQRLRALRQACGPGVPLEVQALLGPLSRSREGILLIALTEGGACGLIEAADDCFAFCLAPRFVSSGVSALLLGIGCVLVRRGVELDGERVLARLATDNGAAAASAAVLSGLVLLLREATWARRVGQLALRRAVRGVAPFATQ